MKKRLMLFLFIACIFVGLPSSVLAGGSNDDKVGPNVKCTYDIYSSLDNRFLTEVYIYFNDQAEYVSKVTHADKNGKEVNFTYVGETNFEGYKSNDFGLNQVLTSYPGYISSYNQKLICPNIYVYRVKEGAQAYTVAPSSDIGILQGNEYKELMPKKKEISKDGITWAIDGNDDSDDNTEEQIITKECSYSFGSDFGLETLFNRFNISTTFEKIENYKNNTISYNVVINDKRFDNVNGSINNNTWRNLYEIGKNSETASNSVILVINEETIKNIIDGNECISKDNVYSYKDPYNSYGDITIVITTNKNEADNSQENIYNGDPEIGLPNLPNDGDNDIDNCEVIPTSIKQYITQALRLIRWIGLVLMIILGLLDFAKAVSSDDQEAVKKAWQKVIKRLIAVIILFLLPLLVDLILDLVNLNNGCKIQQ